MKSTKTQSESAGACILFFAALSAFFLSNSSFSESYFQLIHFPLNFNLGIYSFSTSFLHVINDGAMVVFFYFVALEIKKETLKGSLSDPKKSAFAIYAALGGMILPALLYRFWNTDPMSARGWGIPMATDIAFAIGAIALLGKRIPSSLKIFLLALAIVDDLGAILVIAFFYTTHFSLYPLLATILPLFAIYYLNKKQKLNMYFGVILGIFVWFFILKSGIHATIAGVILAFMTPLQIQTSQGFLYPLEKWHQSLSKYVYFLIMPLFAFFNAGLYLDNISLREIILNSTAQSIFLGLCLGKPLGIFLFCYISNFLNLSKRPDGISWLHILGAGFLAGIGFTMSLFISHLSFTESSIQLFSKSAIFVASLTSGFLGLSFLYFLSFRAKT